MRRARSRHVRRLSSQLRGTPPETEMRKLLASVTKWSRLSTRTSLGKSSGPHTLEMVWWIRAKGNPPGRSREPRLSFMLSSSPYGLVDFNKAYGVWGRVKEVGYLAFLRPAALYRRTTSNQ